MVYDYSKLLGRIKEIYGTHDKFAKELNIGKTSLSLTLNNKREFTQREINKATELLNIKKEEIHKYFFYIKVKKTEQKR